MGLRGNRKRLPRARGGPRFCLVEPWWHSLFALGFRDLERLAFSAKLKETEFRFNHRRDNLYHVL